MSDTDNPVIVRFEPSAEIDGDWSVAGALIYQRFNEPGTATIELHTQDLVAEPTLMLGTSATVQIERAGVVREFSGIVESVEDGMTTNHELVTMVTLVPALVALRHRQNSRIFQEMTVPEILEQVLSEGLGPYQREVDLSYLTGNYPIQEYTVQYQETDFNFVHRLMQEHGINYHFVDTDGAEVMTLHDSDNVYADLVSLGNSDGVLPLVQRGDSAGLTEELNEFRRQSKLRSTVVRTKIFNWLAPPTHYETENSDSVELTTSNGATLEPERESYIHDEPSSLSGYRTAGLEPADVDDDLVIRRAVHQRDAVGCVGVGTAIGMAPAVRFELVDHPQPDLAEQYVVVAVEHAFGSYAGQGYVNTIDCIPASVPWRPDRVHKRPRMPSLQTATVVGPAGEEIHTDEHGRIKVQFHWDREGANDENSSCFLRVIQPWAGNGWGFVFLPRIGMEVAVNFVDGDPDRPIVTGCVYNGANTPPYGLPDEKTKSTIKSNSSPGGNGFNELRFEDAAGSEEIYVHAQKDLNETILNNMSTSVGNDQSLSVGNERSKTVTGNETITVRKDRITTIEGTECVTINGSYNVTIDGGAAKDKGKDPSAKGAGVTVTGEYNIIATEKLTITVGDSKIIIDKTNISLETKATMQLKVGGSEIKLVPDKIDVKSATVVVAGGDGGASTLQLDAKADLGSSGGVKAHQGEANFVLLEGKAEMKGETAKVGSDGEAELAGSPVKVTGGAVTVSGSGIDVTAAGGDVNVTGTTVNLNG